MNYPVTIPVRSAVPTFEPITLAEARYQLALADSNAAHDVPLMGLIQAARQQVERDAMLVCATGSFTWKFTAFCGAEYIEMPTTLRPVTAISSITYVDTSGTTSTWSSSEYALDTASYPDGAGLIRLKYGYSWPTTRGDLNGITVTAVAGRATVADVPPMVKQAVIMQLRLLWQVQHESREVESTQKCYDRIIDQLRPEVYA